MPPRELAATFRLLLTRGQHRCGLHQAQRRDVRRVCASLGLWQRHATSLPATGEPVCLEGRDAYSLGPLTQD